MTEQLKFLCVVISRQCLFWTLHVEYVEEKVRMLALNVIVEWGPIDGKVRLHLILQVLLENGLPGWLIVHENLRQFIITGRLGGLSYILLAQMQWNSLAVCEWEGRILCDRRCLVMITLCIFYWKRKLIWQFFWSTSCHIFPPTWNHSYGEGWCRLLAWLLRFNVRLWLRSTLSSLLVVMWWLTHVASDTCLARVGSFCWPEQILL